MSEALDLTPHIARVRRAEFDRCTVHGEPIAVREDGRVVHIVDAQWDAVRPRGALALLVQGDGREFGVGVEPCVAIGVATSRNGATPDGTERAE